MRRLPGSLGDRMANYNGTAHGGLKMTTPGLHRAARPEHGVHQRPSGIIKT